LERCFPVPQFDQFPMRMGFKIDAPDAGTYKMVTNGEVRLEEWSGQNLDEVFDAVVQ
jgi:hypothetical protein